MSVCLIDSYLTGRNGARCMIIRHGKCVSSSSSSGVSMMNYLIALLLFGLFCHGPPENKKTLFIIIILVTGSPRSRHLRRCALVLPSREYVRTATVSAHKCYFIFGLSKLFDKCHDFYLDVGVTQTSNVCCENWSDSAPAKKWK